MPEIQIPIQPVENPILCSPYREPEQHWLYDTKSGIPPKTPGAGQPAIGLRRSEPAAHINRLLADCEQPCAKLFDENPSKYGNPP